MLPDEVNWPAHNYSHLMEQPTIFYAIVFAPILLGMDVPINVYLAWGYVGLRIVHSLVQATVNIVKYRFPVRALATLCLVGLTVHAGARLLHERGIEREKAPASSTWVDQRNWPTGLTQSRL